MSREYWTDSHEGKSKVEDLPDEIVVHIMGFSSPMDIMHSSSINKQWRAAVSKDEHLWKKLCLRTWDKWQHLELDQHGNHSYDDSRSKTSSSTMLNVISETTSHGYLFQFAPAQGFYSTVNNLWAKIFVERLVIFYTYN
jgi:hypothetical protein